jgi:outer membrane protein
MRQVGSGFDASGGKSANGGSADGIGGRYRSLGARLVLNRHATGGLLQDMRQWVIAGVLILAMAMAGTARAEAKLAYVDIQRALNECQTGKAAKAQFRVRVERIQAKLQQQEAQVQALKDELQKKGMLMKQDERQNIADEYASKLRNFQQSYKDSQEELRQKDNEITRAIVSDLAQVVRTVGEKDGYTMVFEKGTLLWAVPTADITDEVIRSYDAMHVKTAGSLAPRPGGGGARSSRGESLHLGKSNPLSGGGGRSTITK